MLHLHDEMPLRDVARGHGNWEGLCALVPAETLQRLHPLLVSCADPDGCLHWLVRAFSEKPAAFQRLARTSSSLLHLVTVFSHSRFLAEELLQQPEWLEAVGRG